MKKSVKAIVTVLLVAALLVPTVAMLYSSAATEFTVELAFENIFVFDHWANNQNSTRITSDGSGGTSDGTLSDVNIAEGSFKLTNNITTAGIYTTASMGTGEAADENAAFYSMPVESGATYKFAYNATGSMNAGFQPFVFYYDETNEYLSFNMTPATAYGDNSFEFTVPDNAVRIQVRFTMPQGSSYGIIKDIAIYEVETLPNSTPELFDFATWSTKEGSGGGSFSMWSAGTVTHNSTDGSVTLTSNGVDTGSSTGVPNCSVLLTNLAFNASYDDTHYVIDTEPGKKYIVSYDLTGTMDNPSHVSFFPVWHKTDKSYIKFDQLNASVIGNNSHFITAPADAYHFEIVFGLYDYTQTPGVYVTISNISIKEVVEDSFIEHKVEPPRKSYTYNSANNGTYGELPTPPADTIPENYIFAGWYTEKDGKGIRIASDTPILPQSYTVYPKFEPAVDSITVVTPPAKTEYTKGEKLNTTGLVLQATINGKGDTDGDGVIDSPDTTFKIPSGYYCDPEYLNTVGTQAITVHYGNKTTTFNVNVSAGNEKSIVVNGASHQVTVANNEYTLEYQAPSPFNRYEMTYFSDSYVKGEITMDADTEVFFLEPSDNGSFASYIDSFLRGINHYSVVSIKFTCLDKDFGNFELLSLTTIAAPVPGDSMQYYTNDEYKVGIDLAYGGVVSYIEDLDDDVSAAVYTENGKDITKVDYTSKLPSGAKATSNSVNLINTNDRGRYLQQSYYGTNQKPFDMGDYNGNPWPYNPVQGGNLQIQDKTTGKVIKGNESSKVIDYRITNDQIYIKTRPLDWGKNSVDYPDSYVTDSYMEAWYVFEDGMIKTYCRFVDYSGYPANTTTQEMPALYTIEPLNHFVYNDVTAGNEWTTTETLKNIEEPEFWGVLPEYNALLKQNGKSEVNPDVVARENWAAFTASEDEDSFGIGVYSPGVEDIHYGVFPAIYNEEEVKNGNLVENYRHAASLDPAIESPTSYISPVDIYTFESFSPKTYSFYITTGTAEEIYTDFKTVANKDNQAELEKPKIAVPETVYMTPANGASKIGQYYVNNIMDESLNYKVVTEAVRDAGMYFGLHIKDAKEFSVKVTNVTDPSNDIYFCNTSGSEISESTRIGFGAAGTYENDREYGLRFSGAGLQPGEKATAKWEITVYKEDGSSETYTAYTVLYAPGRTVGAVAESRRWDTTYNEISSWITGANGIDHDTFSPLSSWYADYRNSGYFKADPLYCAPLSTGSSESSTDYIDGYGVRDNDDFNDNAYVLQAATNGHGDSKATSYLGLLTVDKSRYTNTDQIPNLQIGFDALNGGSHIKDSYSSYATYYTLGTSESFVVSNDDFDAVPSNWTLHKSYSRGEVSVPQREEVVIPSYKVSEIDGKYIHALGHAKSSNSGNAYATAGTSVLCSVTDKSELRDLVLDGYTMIEDDPEFNEALEKAGTVLGDPSATQDQINEAKKELNDAMEELVEKFYALKYDNLFSAYEYSQHPNSMTVVADRGTVFYENGTLTVSNGDLSSIKDPEAYTNYSSGAGYYLIDLKPNTEYVFEYDVTTTVESQAFLFFYDENGNGWKDDGTGHPAIGDLTVQEDDGTPKNKTESKSWIGNYQDNAGTKHYTITFTTTDKTAKVGFRFGNTGGDPCESTFSNIKLIDSARYYADVEYAKTEDIYKEYSSYGTLPTLTRTGYTFGGWVDAAGNTVTAADIATEHKSIFSVWTEFRYTIKYNANGGSGSAADKTATYTELVTLPSTEFTKPEYKLIGWATSANATAAQYQPGEEVSKLTNVNNGTVTLYAVWASARVNVTFDNLIDMNAWQNSVKGNSAVSAVGETGLSVTNPANNRETTSGSPSFAVTSGKQYKIDIDITGDGWDVYIFFRDSNGTWLHEDGPDSRYSSGVFYGMHEDHVFEAPEGAVKADIRVDSNQKTIENTVKFENIRVYEYDGISPIEVEPSNNFVIGGEAYGTLPTPTKEGFEFLGWVDEKGNTVTADSFVPLDDSLVHLTSQWKLADTSLTEHKFVVDFGSPVAAETPVITEDTVFAKYASVNKQSYDILGLSADENATTYNTSANGTYGTFKLENDKVNYTPASVINAADEVYYFAKLSDGTVYKNIVKVVPASNVLYEEKVFSAVSKDNTAEWTTDGEAQEAETQSASSSTDVYGYDESYNEVSKYSNGTSIKTTVNSTTKRSETQKVEFRGTGFDLIGSCGDTTGVLIVNVKDSTGKIARVFMVDTYYSDSAILSDGGNLNQIPVVSFNDKYDVYTVEVTSAYLSNANAIKKSAVETYAIDGTEIEASSAVLTNDEIVAGMLAEIGMEELANEEIELVWMDENSIFNGGTGAEGNADSEVSMYSTIELDNYIDAIRVYNPMDDDHGDYIASEQGAQYYNVINNLAVTEGGIFNTVDRLFAYIEGSIASGDNIFTDYSSKLPKNELYLSKYTDDKSTGVTFKVNLPENAKVMLSVRAATGSPKLTINGKTPTQISGNTKMPTTEMYYDITDLLTVTNGVAPVAITNTGDGLLAINNIKLVGATPAAVSTFSLEETVALMSLKPVDVEYDGPSMVKPETDDTVDEGDGNEDDASLSCCEKTIQAIRSFFSNIFGYIKQLFELIISFFTTKEVF